jgi:hypothetical protein
MGCPLADISGTMLMCDHVRFHINLWKERGDGGAELNEPWKMLA